MDASIRLYYQDMPEDTFHIWVSIFGYQSISLANLEEVVEDCERLGKITGENC